MSKFTKVFVALSTVALVLAVAVSPAPASAQTTAELQALIASLQAQIAALSGGASTAPASTTFTRDLTVGSVGEDVRALQVWLNSKGYVIATSGAGAPGMESTYFGAKTKAALAAYQAANGIMPAAGYFGPKTRAAVAASAGTGTGTGTGSTGSTGSTGGSLSGGAGSVDSYDEISKYSNEEVGEDEEDVTVAGLEIENSDDSDIRLTAVTLDFATQPGNDDLDEFISEVAIFLDGEEVARVDADRFNDDNDWTRTISLDSGAVIDSGETADLTVAVTGVSNIDSDDAGDTWGLDFTQVRFVDATGASITDDTGTDAFSWSVTTFASAADVELKARLSNDSPDAGVINVDASDDTDGVELLRFTLEAEGSDIEVKDLPITLTATGVADVDLIANSLTLSIDGEEFDETVSTSSVTSATVTFDNIDFTISEGDEVEVVVTADINDLESTFGDGDTLKAEFTATNRQYVDAEDETGEDLATADKTGTALGDEQAFYDAGIYVTFISEETDLTNDNTTANTDTGVLKIKFRVEAFDDTVYVADSSDATIASSIPDTTLGADPIRYFLSLSGTATTAGLSDFVTFTTSGGASDSGNSNIELADGESTDITLSVTRTNSAAATGGIFQLLLKSIGWNTTDSTSVYNVYDFDLEDFKTDTQPIN